METVVVNWKTSLDPANHVHRFTFRFTYFNLIVQKSEVPCDIVAVQAGAEAYIFHVEPDSYIVHYVPEGFDSLIVKYDTASHVLENTDPNIVIAQTIISVVEADIPPTVQYLQPSSKSFKPGQLYAYSGVNDIVLQDTLPLNRSLVDMALDTGAYAANIHAADFDTDYTGGKCLAVGNYAKSTDTYRPWKPLKCLADGTLLVSTGGDQPVIFPSPQQVTFPSPQQVTFPSPQQVTFPSPQQVTFSSPQQVTFPTSQPFYLVPNPAFKRYRAVVPVSGADAYPFSITTTEKSLIAIRPTTYPVVVKEISITIISVSAANRLAFYLKRFTGTLSGGTTITSAPEETSFGNSVTNVVAAGTPSSVITTPRAAAVVPLGITSSTLSTTNPPPIPQPLTLFRGYLVISTSEGYTVQCIGSASATLKACITIVFEEMT